MALDEYEASYRHPSLPRFERGNLYALFPEGRESVGGDCLCWPGDTWPNSERGGVYAILTKTGNILYVGKSDFIGPRLGNYFGSGADKQCVLRHSGWTQQPMYVFTVGVPEESWFEAYSLEMFLIRRLDPPDNTRGRLRPSPGRN